MEKLIRFRTLHGNTVSVVAINRETETSVFAGNRWWPKRSRYSGCFFTNFHDAKEYLLHRAERKIERINRQLTEAEVELQICREMMPYDVIPGRLRRSRN